MHHLHSLHARPLEQLGRLGLWTGLFFLAKGLIWLVAAGYLATLMQ
jgi:hypothetical protein